MLIWHILAKGQEYDFARPAFQAMKLRKVALKAGAPREYGKAGPGRDYWIKEIRHREMEYVKRAEDATLLVVLRRARSDQDDLPGHPSPRI